MRGGAALHSTSGDPVHARHTSAHHIIRCTIVRAVRIAHHNHTACGTQRIHEVVRCYAHRALRVNEIVCRRGGCLMARSEGRQRRQGELELRGPLCTLPALCCVPLERFLGEIDGVIQV